MVYGTPPFARDVDEWSSEKEDSSAMDIEFACAMSLVSVRTSQWEELGDTMIAAHYIFTVQSSGGTSYSMVSGAHSLPDGLVRVSPAQRFMVMSRSAVLVDGVPVGFAKLLHR